MRVAALPCIPRSACIPCSVLPSLAHPRPLPIPGTLAVTLAAPGSFAIAVAVRVATPCGSGCDASLCSHSYQSIMQPIMQPKNARQAHAALCHRAISLIPQPLFKPYTPNPPNAPSAVAFASRSLSRARERGCSIQTQGIGAEGARQHTPLVPSVCDHRLDVCCRAPVFC